MSNFGSYTGDQFFDLKLPKRKWLVENFIKEKDTVMLVGDEKAGKSLIIFQLICSLTSGHPFLDRYEVARPAKVSYIQLEGQIEDSQDRFEKMIKCLDFDRKLFHMEFSPPLSLDNRSTVTSLVNTISAKHTPDVIIIDPIYFALDGDLSDNKAVRAFLGSIHILKQTFNCAILWVHHTHKMKIDKRGGIMNEGDEATFGSKFFKAYPDHTILFSYDKKLNIRTLSCNTQRSGDIMTDVKLNLVQPDPLYFELTEKIPTKESAVFSRLPPFSHEGYDIKQIVMATGLAESTCYATLRNLQTSGMVVKGDCERPVRYKKMKEEVVEIVPEI